MDAARTLFKDRTLPKEIEDYRPPVDLEALLGGANLGKLQELFKTVMRRQEDKIDPIRSRFGKIEREEVSLEDRMAFLEQYILEHPKFSFRSLLEAQCTKMEVIVTFLSILELMKTGKVSISQEHIFDDITIYAGKQGNPVPA